MAPVRPRNARKSTSSTSTIDNVSQFPVPPGFALPTKTGNSPSRTPIRSPNKKKVPITEVQKQALVDNLQLEITRRARNLRAQYAEQATRLRSRLEIRIHRIPAGLKKMTIHELMEKHAASRDESKAVASKETVAPKTELKQAAPANSSTIRGVKRSSTEFDATADKENAPAADIANPKKRTKTEQPTAKVDSKRTSRTASRKVPPSQVLSPKSHNSRSIPQSQSPFKLPTSPVKSNIARPVSPLKPSVAAQTTSSVAKTADKTKAKTNSTASRAPSKQTNATRTASTAQTASGTVRGKRAVAPTKLAEDDIRHSDASDMTATSTGTTVVKKAGRTGAATASKGGPKAKAGITEKITGISAKGKKLASATATATKAEKEKAVGASIKGGRTLRNRPA